MLLGPGYDTLASLGGEQRLTSGAGDDRLDGGEAVDVALYASGRAANGVEGGPEASPRRCWTRRASTRWRSHRALTPRSPSA